MFNKRKNQRVVSIVILVIIVAMLATSVLPYLV